MAICTGPDCDVAIFYAMLLKRDGTKKKMPFNLKPDTEKGNTRVITTAGGVDEARILTGDELAWARRHKESLFIPHHAVCVNAKRFGGK